VPHRYAVRIETAYPAVNADDQNIVERIDLKTAYAAANGLGFLG